MGEDSKIEWTDHTFNPWSGCTKVSPGCANCYAERLSARGVTNGKGERTLGEWGPGAPRKRTSEANWRKPLAWNQRAGSQGIGGGWGKAIGLPPARPRVFCASLADWLDPEVPAEWLGDLLALIAQTPHLDWLLLTKRPELWRDRLLEAVVAAPARRPTPLYSIAGPWLRGSPPHNVWAGTSVEDRERQERLDHLREIPARVRFLSAEPLLERIEPNLSGIHWVICGGESGPGARPMHPDWARSLRDQCQSAGVAFHFKQWGGANKKKAGRLLDGRTWDEFPRA